MKQENTVAAFNKQTLNQHAKRTNAFNVVDSCGAYGCTQRVRGGAYLVKCTLCVHAQSHWQRRRKKKERKVWKRLIASTVAILVDVTKLHDRNAENAPLSLTLLHSKRDYHSPIRMEIQRLNRRIYVAINVLFIV